MRHYPRNSPAAAARLVALAMLADGHLGQAEYDVLDRLGVHQQLGLKPGELQAVMHGLCEDMLAATQHLCFAEACRIDPATLDALLDEVDDPALRQRVLGLCLSVADADGHLADGESVLIAAAAAKWGLSEALVD